MQSLVAIWNSIWETRAGVPIDAFAAAILFFAASLLSRRKAN